MGKRGQALVEFVLIMPVLIMIVLLMFDAGNMVVSKIAVEKDADNVYKMYKESEDDKIKSYCTNKKIVCEVSKKDGFININIEKEVNVITPGLNIFTGSTYFVSTSVDIYE